VSAVGHDLDMFTLVEPEVKVNPKVPDGVRGSDLVLQGMGRVSQPDVFGTVGISM